jgi:hypothetical protein
MIFTRSFWKDTLERVIATFAQALLSALPASYVPGVTLPLRGALAVAGGAAALSLLKCLAASRVGDSDSAALLPDEGGADLPTIIIAAAVCIIVVTIAVLTGVLEH